MVTESEPESLDSLLDALGTTRRRYALYHVRAHGEADVEDVTCKVTHWLATAADDGNDVDRAKVRTSLHHVDLPKLSEAGLVSLDRERGTVTYTGTAVEERLLDVLVEHERLPVSPTCDDDTFYLGV